MSADLLPGSAGVVRRKHSSCGTLSTRAALIVSLCLFLGPLAPSLAFGNERCQRLAEQCRKGKESACERLASIARGHKDSQQRIAAVKATEDEALLAEIAQDGGRPERCQEGQQQSVGHGHCRAGPGAIQTYQLPQQQVGRRHQVKRPGPAGQ